jgi:CheY-like chemotaxis protein
MCHFLLKNQNEPSLKQKPKKFLSIFCETCYSSFFSLNKIHPNKNQHDESEKVKTDENNIPNNIPSCSSYDFEFEPKSTIINIETSFNANKMSNSQKNDVKKINIVIVDDSKMNVKMSLKIIENQKINLNYKFEDIFYKNNDFLSYDSDVFANNISTNIYNFIETTNEKIDLIITDMHMPIKDGIDIIEIASTKNIPIYVVSNEISANYLKFKETNGEISIMSYIRSGKFRRTQSTDEKDTKDLNKKNIFGCCSNNSGKLKEDDIHLIINFFSK